jgi:hypothetical protein
MQRVFLSGTTVRDIAEPLISFDAWTDATRAQAILEKQGQEVAGVRAAGHVAGYVLSRELASGVCGEVMHPFTDVPVISDHTPLTDTVLALVDSSFVFVRVLGEVGGIVTREDLQDPPVRMWLFGMVTLIEMYYVRMIEQNLREEEWREYLSSARLAKAKKLREERRRRGQDPRLVDCLQFGDKAQIIARHEGLRNAAGFLSRNRAERAGKNLERLRNNLAHTQDIVAWDWDTIVLLAQNLDRLIQWDASVR